MSLPSPRTAQLASVTSSFRTLPRVLILHLKRFRYDTTLQYNTKLEEPVVVPSSLTTQAQCSSGIQLPRALDCRAEPTVLLEGLSEEELLAAALQMGLQESLQSGPSTAPQDKQGESPEKQSPVEPHCETEAVAQHRQQLQVCEVKRKRSTPGTGTGTGTNKSALKCLFPL
nr:PREDICTED: ubiquitin carboxyl-terminal hydrolase 37-like isoform X2 [Lepisosteus oculatus]